MGTAELFDELPPPSVSRLNAHDCTVGTEEWLTPPHILQALGPFDLDPAAPPAERRPWPMAAEHYCQADNGLIRAWAGFVWCNPPYGGETRKWFRRMADHNNGIALTFARTETQMFFESVWGVASALVFLKGRLRFCKAITGSQGNPLDRAGAPSVLIAYGDEAVRRVCAAVDSDKIAGAVVMLNLHSGMHKGKAMEVDDLKG